jgi:WD40 repeat protein
MNAPSEVAWKVCAHKSETTCLTFNRDGDIVYTGGADGIVKGWRVSDGKEVCQMGGL